MDWPDSTQENQIFQPFFRKAARRNKTTILQPAGVLDT